MKMINPSEVKTIADKMIELDEYLNELSHVGDYTRRSLKITTFFDYCDGYVGTEDVTIYIDDAEFINLLDTYVERKRMMLEQELKDLTNGKEHDIIDDNLALQLLNDHRVKKVEELTDIEEKIQSLD